MALSSLGMVAAFTGCVCVFAAGATAQRVSSGAPITGTKLVLLGTGTPPADPDRSGPASAIVVNDTPYLIDFGAGVVRRAMAAVAERGIEALDPVKLRVVFLTHMHSDHTVGYPDLILTPWVLGRRVPLEVYGPAGLEEMTSTFLPRTASISSPATSNTRKNCTKWAPSRRATPSTRTRSSPASCIRTTT